MESFTYGRSIILGLPHRECCAYHYKSICSQMCALQHSLQSAVEWRVAQYNMLGNSGFGWQTINSEPLDFSTENWDTFRSGHFPSWPSKLQVTCTYRTSPESKLCIYSCVLRETFPISAEHLTRIKNPYYSYTQPAHLPARALPGKSAQEGASMH